MSWPWSQLGLPGPSELSEVRHAYAEKLKTTHPEEDPEGFQRLHSAYQLASRMARQQKRREGAPPPEPQPERPPQPQRVEFNYDEPLRGGGEEPRFRAEDEERDFDYDELLQDGGEESRRRKEDEEQDFDYDELLRDGGEEPRRPEEEDQDFDFERLFAEGEAERAEARRRRAEERRKEQRQQRNRREEQLNLQFRQQEDRWQNTETILHTIEMLYSSGAKPEEWKKFFLGPMFQQNKDSLDVIFGLEDFVSTKSLSRQVQSALFMAYGFDKGVSRPEQRPLFQMLLPAWKAEKKSNGFPWHLMFYGFLCAVVFLVGIGPLLDSGLLSIALSAAGLVFILWVVKRVVVLGTREKRARGRNVSKRQERRAIFLGMACVAGVILLLSWVRARPGFNWKDILPTKDPREQTCRYMEQDFGEEMGSLYNLSAFYASDTYSNVFYLDSDPNNKQFLAGPDGDRDVKNGQSGYTTNFPEMMMLWALKDFAYQRKIYNVDSVDRNQKLELWDTGGTFVITLPAAGAGEVITDLGELLEELSREQWYQAQLPQCELVLCSRQMVEGRLILFRWHPADGVFDAEAVRELYETTFAHSYCAQLIRELELDRDFICEEGARYTLTNEGMAQMKGKDCCKLFGLNEDGVVEMEYYVDLEASNIYCVPGNFWENGNSEEQINFYRLLHWGDHLGVINLFYPWLRVN